AEGPSPSPPEVPHSKPASKNVPGPNTPTSASQKSKSDGEALRSLTMPPASLRNLSVTPPPVTSGEVKGTAASGQPKLSTNEAIELANAEARAQGFNLAEYEQPGVKYLNADGTWSISYSQKSGE